MATQKKNILETEEILMLLRAVNENPQMTQRDLSVSVGLSLGKINYLIRAMIEKGYVKAENFKNSKNKIAYLYFLTPYGVEEKLKITYHFLKRKMVEYEKLEKEIHHLKEEVSLLDHSTANWEKS
jgi:EPS-associated MarR family transcriptional regulator